MLWHTHADFDFFDPEGTSPEMSILIAGLALFFAVHIIPTRSHIKSRLVERFGDSGYKIAFTVAALIGLALIVIGFGRLQTGAGWNPHLWSPPVWARHLAFALMWPAMVLLVASFVPSHIRTRMRHPLLAAIKIWALGHLLANGDLASLLLFGSFLAYAIYDRISVKYREAAPSRPAPAGPWNDVLVVAVGTGLYVFMLLIGHARLIGVPLLPGWV